MKHLWLILLIHSLITSQDWVVELNKKYSPATTIIAVAYNDGSVGFGTGFNVKEDGLVITNHHVIESAKKIKVRFKNGDIYDVQYYSFIDKNKDFAILKIPGFKLPIVELGDSESVEIGQEVIAIGNPKGAWHSVTKGIISQIVKRETHEQFQTDVFIAEGSSGGPLFDNNQKLIGVTTSGVQNTAINFAIPINYVRGAINTSNYASRREVGYDIIEVASNYKPSKPKYIPPKPKYKPSTTQVSYQTYFYTFNSSYFIGTSDHKPSGWSIGFGVYDMDPLLRKFDYAIYNIIYMDRKYNLETMDRANGESVEINEVGLGIEFGNRIKEKISFSFGYSVSFMTAGTFNYFDGGWNPDGKWFSLPLEFSKSTTQRHRAILALNYSIPKIMVKIEYLVGSSATLGLSKPIDVQPSGLRLRFEMPIKKWKRFNT